MGPRSPETTARDCAVRERGLGALIRDLGVPTVSARTAALHQLVLQAPALVVAQALGFHRITTHRAVAEAGGTWSRYVPGDHDGDAGMDLR